MLPVNLSTAYQAEGIHVDVVVDPAPPAKVDIPRENFGSSL